MGGRNPDCVPDVFLSYSCFTQREGGGEEFQWHPSCIPFVTILCSEWRGREEEGRQGGEGSSHCISIVLQWNSDWRRGERGDADCIPIMFLLCFLIDDEGGTEWARNSDCIPIVFRLAEEGGDKGQGGGMNSNCILAAFQWYSYWGMGEEGIPSFSG